jgi:hypothetical protein
VDHKVGPSKMKVENGDEEIFLVKIIKLNQWFFGAA